MEIEPNFRIALNVQTRHVYYKNFLDRMVIKLRLLEFYFLYSIRYNLKEIIDFIVKRKN